MKTRKAKLRIAAIAGAAVVAIGLTSVTQFASAAERPAAAPKVSIKLPANILAAVQAVHPGPGFVPIAAYQVGLIASGPLASEGTQTYTCDANGAWPTRSTPEADLVRVIGFGPAHIHHYAGPRWSAPSPGGGDGSTVVGVLPPAASNTPDSTALPWLLLDVTHEGPAGPMDQVARINRVLTKGGLPPAGSCTPGQTATVDYGAVYVFWAGTS